MIDIGRVYLDQIVALPKQVNTLELQLRTEAAQDDVACQIQRIPGISPIWAMAVTAFSPPMESFCRGSDFAAWLCLVPKQHSTGGKPS